MERRKNKAFGDDEKIAWAAGLFEGEGCFFLARTGSHWYAKAALTSTDRDVVERFHRIVSVGYVIGPETRDDVRKDQFVWRVSSRAGFNYFASLIEPWLCERRKAQLEGVREGATEPVRRYAGRRS